MLQQNEAMTDTSFERSVPHQIHEVDIGGRWIRAGIFAIPLLIPEGAQTEQAEVSNIDQIAKLLHGPGGFGSEVQGFCLFPWIVRPSVLSALIPGGVQRQVAQALVQDALLAAQGDPSRVEIGVSQSLHKKCGLGYLLGVVMVDEEHEIDPFVPKSPWEKGVGDAFEAMLRIDGGNDVFSVTGRIRALPPEWVEDALLSGLLEAADHAIGGTTSNGRVLAVHVLNVREGVSEVRLVGADTVAAIHLQRDLVGDEFVSRLCQSIQSRYCRGHLNRRPYGNLLN